MRAPRMHRQDVYTTQGDSNLKTDRRAAIGLVGDPTFQEFCRPEALHDTGHQNAGRRVSGIGRVGVGVLGLFALSIGLAVAGHHLLHLPPVLGMMTGLGLFKIFSHRLTRADPIRDPPPNNTVNSISTVDILAVMART